jgi:hypothetical protein
MKVYLVPLGAARHVPYCEPAESLFGSASPGEDQGLLARLMQRFRDVIAAAEQHRVREADARAPQGWWPRTKAWVLRWIADRIAEQRLLWQLRHCESATLVYPSDMSDSGAMQALRQELTRDRDRHRRWLLVNVVLLIAAGVLAIVPGPNLIAYYFAFRVVGHYFAMRGAGQGLARVAWSLEMSPVLGDLRQALRLDPPARHVQVRDIGLRLDLPHLATFVERVALKGA